MGQVGRELLREHLVTRSSRARPNHASDADDDDYSDKFDADDADDDAADDDVQLIPTLKMQPLFGHNITLALLANTV